MGCVYRARHRTLGNTIALKENLVSHMSEQFMRLFEQEGKLLANLYHPQLPRVQDFFIEDARSFFVMEYVEGQSLADLLSQSGEALPEERVRELAVNVCGVLEYLHNRKPPIVHCDIKPHNLLLTPEGSVKLLDLGIAKLITETSEDEEQMAFTPAYAAPEQWAGKATPRSDIFGLGATMYNLLTGRTIRTSFQPEPFLEACPPLRALAPEVSRGLEEIVNKCLRERAEERWQTARALREALEKLHSEVDSETEARASARYDVFISYRRQNGAAEARGISGELKERKFKSFLDVDDLGAGYFDQALLNCIAATPNFILVLSPHCLDRCADESDWLRREIVQALETNRNIVPVALPGFQFPEPEELPLELRPLSSHNSVLYSHEYFKAMVDKIERYLRRG
jgi:serine/threonine-protein kinase